MATTQEILEELTPADEESSVKTTQAVAMSNPDGMGPLGGEPAASAVSVSDPSSRQERPPPAARAAAPGPTMPSTETFKKTYAYASMSAKGGKYVKEDLLPKVAAMCKDALAKGGAFSEAPTELKNFGIALADKHKNCTSNQH